ncbi:hypothetical protein [Rufibacter roseus]|uniref:DUF3365 domain-containing protein n=1 Tax=Rufibacter roseus TaxID=1567108 RepID=A0ABW2DJM4_9BACT|nr:hypothetical protein [Rufibacter roseus]
MSKRKVVLGIVGFGFLLAACEPEKLERGKEMAVEAERHKVKRITQEDMEARALAAGDTIVGLIEGAFLQLAEAQPKEQELFVGDPAKLPMVQKILQRYNAQLTRLKFATEAEAKQYLSQHNLSDMKGAPKANVQLSVRDQEFLYQRPIVIKRRNCASCDEPSLLDFSAPSLEKLRVFSAQGKPNGYEEGQIAGVWQISFPKKKVVEQITLKTKVSRRGRGGFFGSNPDSVNKK